MHTTSPDKLPDIFVPHYEEHCRCFSCRWVRETKHRFVLSKLEDPPFPVVNPTHIRVSQDERQRLLTPVSKKKFQIMYIYAMQLEDKTWGWVVVLPLPLLPFLLTDEKYSEVSRFARHPVDGWFGLREDGQKVDIDQEMEPPLYNPFYKHYGYDPRCSPYRLYQAPPEGNASDDEAKSSTANHASSSTQSPTTSRSPESSTTDPTSEDQAGSSIENKDEQSCEKQLVLSIVDGTDSTSTDQTNSATVQPTDQSTGAQTNTSPEAHVTSSEANATSSEPPADQPTPENIEWVVFDVRCANPPEPTGDVNNICKHPGHNGRYYGTRCDDRHTNWRNTTIFVGGLRAGMTREALHCWFEGFGELLHVRKKTGDTHGFVQYPGRKEAEMAMSQMQGYPISGARLRLSWGSPEKQMDPAYQEYHQRSAWEAYMGYVNFWNRMARNEPRRGDPDFWVR